MRMSPGLGPATRGTATVTPLDSSAARMGQVSTSLLPSMGRYTEADRALVYAGTVASSASTAADCALMADLCSDFSTSAVCLRIAFFIGPIVMCKPALAVASAAQWRAGLVRILQRLVGLQTRGRPMGGYNLPKHVGRKVLSNMDDTDTCILHLLMA